MICKKHLAELPEKKNYFYHINYLAFLACASIKYCLSTRTAQATLLAPVIFMVFWLGLPPVTEKQQTVGNEIDFGGVYT